MGESKSWIGSRSGRFVLGGVAGLLGAALLLALRTFFDLDIKSTPVYHARVGLQPHRPVHLVYGASPKKTSPSWIEFTVEVLDSGKSTTIRGKKASETLELAVGTKVRVALDPKRENFNVTGTSSNGTALQPFSLQAEYDASSHYDEVLEPEVSEAKTIDEETITTITVMMRERKCVLTLVESLPRPR